MRKISYPSKLVILLKLCAMIATFVLVTGLFLWAFAPRQFQSFLDRSGLLPDQEAVFSIGTASPGGHYVRIAQLIREEMAGTKVHRVNVMMTEGSLENAGLVQQGLADFALIQGGLSPETVEGLVAVAQVGWQYVHIVVPVDSALSSFRDLKGKRVAMGPVRSGNHSLGARIFNYFWPKEGAVPVNNPIKDIEANFADGTIDAAFLVYDHHAPVIERLLESGHYRLLPIREAASIAHALPGVYEATLEPGTYGPERDIPSADEPRFSTLKVKTLMVTSENCPSFAVERLLRVIYSPTFINRARLTDHSEENGRMVKEMALHPAATRFFQRNDPITADKFEIGSFFLALVLALGTVLAYLSRKEREAHLDRLRERIVPYFEQLLSCSEDLARVEDVEALNGLLGRMMETQRNAEKDWLKGRLDTEHMENLYTIYGIHCSNAFQKMQMLLQNKRLEMLEAVAAVPSALVVAGDSDSGDVTADQEPVSDEQEAAHLEPEPDSELAAEDGNLPEKPLS